MAAGAGLVHSAAEGTRDKSHDEDFAAWKRTGLTPCTSCAQLILGKEFNRTVYDDCTFLIRAAGPPV